MVLNESRNVVVTCKQDDYILGSVAFLLGRWSPRLDYLIIIAHLESPSMPLEKFQSTSWCSVNRSTQLIQNSQCYGLTIVLSLFTTCYVSSCNKSCEFFLYP